MNLTAAPHHFCLAVAPLFDRSTATPHDRSTVFFVPFGTSFSLLAHFGILLKSLLML
jgi:hypothetical protein